MNEEFSISLERVLQTTPSVYIGEAPSAAASFNTMRCSAALLGSRTVREIYPRQLQPIRRYCGMSVAELGSKRQFIFAVGQNKQQK